MKKLCCILAVGVLAGVGSGELFAQPAPGEIVEYPDTSLTACPDLNQVLSHFYYLFDHHPSLRGESWRSAKAQHQ